MAKIVHEGRLEFDYEDGRMAMIGEISEITPGNEFFRVQSWDETKRHSGLIPFIGRKIRITLETID